LKERLRKWQELHPPPQTAASSGTEKTLNGTGEGVVKRTICIRGFAEMDLLEDDDEFDELVNNLQDMAKEVAPFDRVFIPKVDQMVTDDSVDSEDIEYPAFVSFAELRGAEAAVSCWNGLNMGGQKLTVEHADVEETETGVNE